MVGIAEVVGAAVVIGSLLVTIFEGVDFLFVAVRCVAQLE